MPSDIDIDEVLDRFEVVLLDAYGVLNDARGPLPGARELIDRLRRDDHPFLVVTNDASRLPETCAARFEGMGLAIPADRILTSGLLLADHFAAHALHGARCMVLGPEDSHRYVRAAGGEPVPCRADVTVDCVVVADDDGYPFLPTIEAVMSAVFRALEAGEPVHLVLPNPDLIYPKERGMFGFTSGAVALLLEAALERRFSGAAPRFARLGKPHAPMFEAARTRARERWNATRLLMIGDQLETDIRGALAAGIDAALLDTGVSAWRHSSGAGIEPTYLLPRLCAGQSSQGTTAGER